MALDLKAMLCVWVCARAYAKLFSIFY
uniref:Uncharacterized protein n=1 Tax=Anguilla anguilla TaxID=7936 RepID=A0A0E9TAK7_ANGAN